MIKLLLATFITLSVSAKLFPVPFSKQLKEADGIIYGEFLGESYKKLPDDKIVTEASFRLIQSVGLNNRYLVNKNLFRVQYDGGVWQGLRHRNPNAPKFNLDVKYVILLKKGKYAFSPLMDKLGTYEVMKDREVLGIKSLAFPRHPQIGFIPYKTFDLWVKTVYGTYMSQDRENKFVFVPSVKQDRKPAALEEKKPMKKKTSIGIFWFAILFGVLGALKLRRKRQA